MTSGTSTIGEMIYNKYEEDRQKYDQTETKN